MSLLELLTVLTIAIGLSMDAFAVAITQGACLEIKSPKYPLVIGGTFGLFQAFMPLFGWVLGASFYRLICNWDHWIALLLLSGVGIRMLYEGYKDFKVAKTAKANGFSCPLKCKGKLPLRSLLTMAVATSIDALAVGITFGMLRLDIFYAIVVIGITTFLFSAAGVLLGKKTGPLLGDWMEMVGGTILILLGLKIFIEHLVKGI
ncbi:MAG: manganese efflux pump MntP family protein [Sphaerochaetaceae bacterium]